MEGDVETLQARMWRIKRKRCRAKVVHSFISEWALVDACRADVTL